MLSNHLTSLIQRIEGQKNVQFLVKETALSHEQIEGWYKMLMRKRKERSNHKRFLYFLQER